MRATLAVRPAASTPICAASPSSVRPSSTPCPSQLLRSRSSGTASPGASGPMGYLRRKSASNTIQAGMAPPVACVVGVHRLLELGVGAGFVDEALAARVHHQAAGQRAFDEQRAELLLLGHRQCRRAPAVRHQVQGAACRGTGLDGVTGVAPGRRRRPGLVGGLRQVLLAHGLVALEAAGTQQHARRAPTAIFSSPRCNAHPSRGRPRSRATAAMRSATAGCRAAQGGIKSPPISACPPVRRRSRRVLLRHG
jgi:hypothetical protein